MNSKRPSRARRQHVEPPPLAASVVLALPVAMAAIFFVWTRLSTVQLGYALSEAGAEHHALLETQRALRVELAALRAPERLQLLGRRDFGLGPPASGQVVYLEGPNLARPAPAASGAVLALRGDSPEADAR